MITSTVKKIDFNAIRIQLASPERVREWSFGEAMGYNLKNNYPFAMAEKRAKDRVILKLAGLHGVYSEEEAEDFKESLRDGTAKPVATSVASAPRPKPAWIVQLETRFGRNDGKVTNFYLKEKAIQPGQTWRDVPETTAKKMRNNTEGLCKMLGI